MSSGVCVVEVWAELLSGGQVEVKAELSDGSFLQLNRTDEDLAQMMKRLVDSFHDDREMLSSSLLTGLLRVRAADQSSDPELKTVEVNKLLKTIIKLPHKFSQSEAVLAFFEPPTADRTFRQDENQNQTFRPEQDQPVREEDKDEDKDEAEDEEDLVVFQSPLVHSDVLMSNGFCLANTETILFDLTPPTHHVAQSDDSSGRRASVSPAVCLQLCRPSVSPHLLRGFTGMMGRLVKRRSFPAPATCCSPGLRRQTSWTE